MTGYTVHTGSTVKYSAGWDNIFGAKTRKSGADGTKKPAKARKRKGRAAGTRKKSRARASSRG
jgi:hypothetical protein